MTTKQTDALLARHAKLREAHSAAFAAVETSDAPADSATAKRLAKRRDAAFAKLAPVAAKLREQGYTLAHDDSAPVPPAAEEAPGQPAPAAPKGFIDAALMERAIELRKDGLTMKQIGAELNVKATAYLAKKIKEQYGAEALAKPTPTPEPTAAPAKPARKPRATKAAKSAPVEPATPVA
jgi:hypothetical protein